jgi:hypothetical protein
MTLNDARLLGFVELTVGSLQVQVPIRALESATHDTPLARFEVHGNKYAIMVSEESRSETMRKAVEEAAEDALRHLSKKLLN